MEARTGERTLADWCGVVWRQARRENPSASPCLLSAALPHRPRHGPRRAPDFDRWFCGPRSAGGSPPLLLLPPLPVPLLLPLLEGGPLLVAASLLPPLLLLLLPPLLASEAQQGRSRACRQAAMPLPAGAASCWTACLAGQQTSAESGRRAPAPGGLTAAAVTVLRRRMYTGAGLWSSAFLPVVEGCARTAGTAEAPA